MTSYKQYLDSIDDCPFCTKNTNVTIYTGTYHNIIVALAPYKDNHFLIIPHKHIISLTEYTPEMLQELCTLQQQLMTYLYAQGHHEINLLVRDGNDHSSIKPSHTTTGKSLNHFHYHIIPDCHLKTQEFAQQSSSDKRPLITNETIATMRTDWNHRLDT